MGISHRTRQCPSYYVCLSMRSVATHKQMRESEANEQRVRKVRLGQFNWLTSFVSKCITWLIRSICVKFGFNLNYFLILKKVRKGGHFFFRRNALFHQKDKRKASNMFFLKREKGRDKACFNLMWFDLIRSDRERWAAGEKHITAALPIAPWFFAGAI